MKSKWADHAVRAMCGNLSGKCALLNWSGTSWPQLSLSAQPLWTNPGLKSGTGMPELISTSKNKTNKKVQARNESSNLSRKSSHSQARKIPSPILASWQSMLIQMLEWTGYLPLIRLCLELSNQWKQKLNDVHPGRKNQINQITFIHFLLKKNTSLSYFSHIKRVTYIYIYSFICSNIL